MEQLRRIVARPDWPFLSGLALAVVGLLETYLYTSDSGARLFTVYLTLMATLPLMVRRTHPKIAIATTTLATIWLIVSAKTTADTFAVLVAQAWAFYLLASRFRAWVVLLVGVPYVLLLLGAAEPTLYNVLLLASGITAMGVGRSRRLTGQVSAVKADQAVLEERARIARELHDVVAHHVSTIAIQADTARLTTPGMPPEGGERLEAIGQTARDAMAEMRRVLGVLRTEDGGERAPQPGLDRLPELIETARSAGTPVRLVLEGPMTALSPGVELTAYRVIQEALTNARRHAPGAAVEVALHYGASGLRLRVSDDGPGPGRGEDGHGLRGMRERVAMVGGELETGSADSGGFLVEARLPT